MIIVDENNEKIKKSEKYKVAPETRLATQNHVKRVMSKRIVYNTCNRLVRICILYHSYSHDTETAAGTEQSGEDGEIPEEKVEEAKKRLGREANAWDSG